jgi:Fe-S cluster assembly protein SufB
MSISEAIKEHPELVRKYLGTVVPQKDNFMLEFSCFSDGSFCYIPKGVRCPMELSTYFRINKAEQVNLRRTLLIADEGSYVSYLEGCTAPVVMNQLHAAVVELVAWTMLKSNIRPYKTGILETKKVKVEFSIL